MASKATSRWANDEEDAAFEAQRKKEKEEKKRLKAEKQRKLDAAKQAAEAERQRLDDARSQRHNGDGEKSQNGDDPDDASRPTKRRRISPPAPTHERRLLRFPSQTWTACRSVEDFEKLNDIEEGAYGWVSRARDERTGAVVALKRLKMEHAADGIPVTGLREMQILRDCAHVNIVKLQEVVVGEDRSKIENIFLVLDFVEHDLKTLLEAMPEPFLPSETKTLLQQLAAGVAYLHDHWILHRDLKTSNLLLSNRGILKIADFGMARYHGDPQLGALTQLVVTLWYRAPELLLGATDYGAPVDLWSVGCIFAELLTRDPLFQGANEAAQVSQIFALCGLPDDASWPGFRRLPNARSLRLPPPAQRPPAAAHGALLRAKFPFLTQAGAALLRDLLALNPAARPAARDVLQHAYFREDPRPKSTDMFPTFPSKAGLEKRRRRATPEAPTRGAAPGLDGVDFSGIFAGRDDEVRGGGFELKLV